MKVVFLGTPDFAVPSLKAIINSTHEVVAVVTQPDRAVGRSGKPVFSPVKAVALENGIKVFQYEKIRLEGVSDLKSLNADIMVTCAFGQILSQEIIDVAPHGIINVHGSLLPKYRGASPIQWAIINGDSETGVTIMQTEAGIDCGDIIACERTPIYPDETAGELFDRLSVLGSRLIVKTLDDIEAGKAVYTPQNSSDATHVKMLKKSDGMLDFENNYETLDCFVRGMYPWPCAYTYYNGKLLKVFKIEKVDLNSDAICGSVIKADSHSGLVVKVANGGARISQLQLEGSRKMTDLEFLLGHKIAVGEKLGRC